MLCDCQWAVRQAVGALAKAKGINYYALLFATLGFVLTQCSTLPTTTAMPVTRWVCSSEISTYTDAYCEEQPSITGCYYLELYGYYQSCAKACNDVVQNSNDEDRCKSYCPDYLSAEGGCTLSKGVTPATDTGTQSVENKNKLDLLALLVIPVAIVIVIVGVCYYKRRRKSKEDKRKADENNAKRNSVDGGQANGHGGDVSGRDEGNNNGGDGGPAGDDDHVGGENRAGNIDDVDAPPPNARPERADPVGDGAAEPAADEPIIHQPENYSKEETNQPEDSAGDENDINQGDERDPLIPNDAGIHVRPSGQNGQRSASNEDVEMRLLSRSGAGNEHSASMNGGTFGQANAGDGDH